MGMTMALGIEQFKARPSRRRDLARMKMVGTSARTKLASGIARPNAGTFRAAARHGGHLGNGCLLKCCIHCWPPMETKEADNHNQP